jgi:hypothetical protein
VASFPPQLGFWQQVDHLAAVRAPIHYFEKARLHFDQYASDQEIDPAPLNWATVEELRHIVERHEEGDHRYEAIEALRSILPLTR